MTARESALVALFAVIRTVNGPESRRGGEMPTRVPSGGLLILRDGDPGEPEITMSPLIYEYRHRAEVEVIVQPPAGTDLPGALDAVLHKLGAAISADPTLGGAVLWSEAVAPEAAHLALEGVAGVVAAVVPVEMTYTTTGPLA